MRTVTPEPGTTTPGSSRRWLVQGLTDGFGKPGGLDGPIVVVGCRVLWFITDRGVLSGFHVARLCCITMLLVL